MKKTWIGFLALAFTAGCAEVEMRGMVRDQTTGEPLPGATVRVGEHETTTDLTGYYQFDVDESDDAKEILVTKSGYQPYIEDVKIDADRADEMIQDFELQPKGRESSQPGRTQIPREEDRD